MAHLTSITLREALPRPLNRGTIDFDKRVNVFIGPNASGKSTLLRAIQERYFGDITYDTDLLFSGDWPDQGGDKNAEIASADAIPLLYIPATRIHLSRQSAFSVPSQTSNIKDVMEMLEELFLGQSDIFDGEQVEAVIRSLVQYSLPAPEEKEIDDEIAFEEALRIGYSCAKEICREIMHGNVPQSYVYFRRYSYNLEPSARTVLRPSMGIVTIDETLDETPLYTGMLSAGTQGSLLWIWALALKMWYHYQYEYYIKDIIWEDEPAILLIDEIENHLHPTWQRRVIPALLEHFPGLQIFATTHSPFVVAGLRAGQVHLLKRDERGRVTATTNTEDVVGWTADEILRNMMGVDDPTDDATAAAARELRQLRNAMPHADEEAEAERQERMQELRKRVDRDLLAGGPMKARREQFEAEFAKALEEYRRSRELNQDNG